MHLVISAKAGTDHEKFKAAAREFLQDQYAGHQFMFALHTDKEASGHLHAHAIIAMKSQTGEKLRSNKPDLEEWRYRFADHAQAQGLQIVATKAMDQASSRSYGPRDKAIIDVADQPRARRIEQDRAYARDPQNASIIDNARRRVEKARTNPVRIPQTEPEKIAVNDSVRNWTALAKEQPQNAIVTDSLTRVTLASMSGNLLGVLQTHVEYLAREGKTAMAATSEEMRADLRVLNEAASSVSEILPPGTREQFNQQSARYLEKIAERVDLQRSVETRTPQAQAVLGPVVEEARRVAQVETREAEQAAAVADRARASDRRAEAKPDAPGGSPGEIDTKRAIVRDTEALAATERREAETARDAARQLTANAATPLTPSQADDARFERLRLHQADALRQIASQRASANEAENEAEQ